MVQLTPDDVTNDPMLADKLMLLLDRIGHGVTHDTAAKLRDAGYTRVFQAVDLDRAACYELGLTKAETDALFSAFVALDARFAAFALSSEFAELCAVAAADHDDKPTKLRRLCAKVA